MTQVHLDPYDHAFQANPYPYYKALRDHDPVYYNEERRLWLLTKWEDVRTALRDFKIFRSAGGVALDDSSGSAFPFPMFITSDPPDHTRQRQLFAPLMTPEKVGGLEAYTRQRAVALITPHLATGRFDFVADLGVYLPMDVISTLVGVPAADQDKVRGWADDIVSRDDGQGEVSNRNINGYMSLAQYFDAHVSHHLAAGGRENRGLLSVLINAERQRVMTHQEAIGTCILLAIAGNETTTKLIGNMAYHLWRNPDQRQLLLDNPGLLEKAVEEVLRLDGSSQIIARMVASDVEIRGKLINAGSRVGLCIISANRDEEKFPDPDKFAIARGSREHMAFGFGLHSCLGAALARMEIRVVFEEILKRIPHYEIDEAGLSMAHSPNVRGFTRVPARFDMPGLRTAA